MHANGRVCLCVRTHLSWHMHIRVSVWKITCQSEAIYSEPKSAHTHPLAFAWHTCIHTWHGTYVPHQCALVCLHLGAHIDANIYTSAKISLQLILFI